MRYVSDSTELEIMSVVDAVRKDKESWKNWHCMKIEILAQGQLHNWKTLSTNITRILEIYLEGKQGTVITSTPYKTIIFCKDVFETLLDTMGRQVVDLIKTQSNIAGLYRIYEMHDDADALIRSFDRERAIVQACGEQEKLQEQYAALQPGQLPEILQSRSDGLSAVTSRKVLLVEDDPVTRWMVKMALRDNCRLAVVPDANKAISMYQSLKPDMVLLDINLPDKNGHDVMASIMKCDPGAHIVMFSSHDSLENMVETMSAGAKGFIAKPFNKERLLAYVNGCPGGH